VRACTRDVAEILLSTISEREVSPKFVFGKKKYGRRSRPESTDQDWTIEEDENLEHTELEIFVPIEDKTKEMTVVCVKCHPYIMEVNVTSLTT
jgi:formylmethanofuran dehydrogenase subunit E